MPLSNLHGGYTHSSSGEPNDGARISNLVGLHFTMTGAAHTTSETGLFAGKFQRFGLMPCEREVCVCNRGLWESPRRWSAAEATKALSCLFKRCCPIGNRADEVPGSGFWRRLTPWGIISS